MQVKVDVDKFKYSENGIKIKTAKRGDIIELSDDMAKPFIENKTLSVVKRTYKKRKK